MIGPALFALWCGVLRRAGASWKAIPLLNRVPLPGWMQSKVDEAIGEAINQEA